MGCKTSFNCIQKRLSKEIQFKKGHNYQESGHKRITIIKPELKKFPVNEQNKKQCQTVQKYLNNANSILIQMRRELDKGQQKCSLGKIHSMAQRCQKFLIDSQKFTRSGIFFDRHLSKKIIHQINVIRNNPKIVISQIKHQMDRYIIINRFIQKDKNIIDLNSRFIQTKEGITHWQQTANYIDNQHPVSQLIYDQQLSYVAHNQAFHIDQIGYLTQRGLNNEGLVDRIHVFSAPSNNYACELKSIGWQTLKQNLLTFIIDDGVSSRSNRKEFFGDYQFGGAAMVNNVIVIILKQFTR